MPGSVKNKIRNGTIFLFVLVILTGAFSLYNLVRLRQQSASVLKANYESLQFAHRMQISVDSILTGKTAYLDSFSQQLSHQEKNITEKGEFDLTRGLRVNFQKLSTKDQAAAPIVKMLLQRIIEINMQAINRKYESVDDAADRAMAILITALSFILLIGFTFVVNFPSIVTAPIRKLTEAIRQIGEKNYSHRIHIDSNDEFGEMASSFNDMAGRLEFFESSNLNKIIFEKSRAEAVINSLKDASIGIDKNGIVLFANNQAMQLLGLETKDIIGLNVSDIITKNDLFKFLLEEKTSTPFKIVIDNRENYFTKEIIEISQDGLTSKVIVLKNITSFRELDVAKTNFIATISHELKTPLAASDLSLKLLEDSRVGILSDEQAELVQMLRKDNQRMLRILSELLNMSQVESGKIQLNIQPVDPVHVIESSLVAIEASLKEHKITVHKTIDADLPAIQADSDKIVWVLNNFLTNAIRYSPSESIIDISARTVGTEVSFAITDRGQGIDEQYLTRIFDRYFQVPGRSDRKGSGIGLAICKEFVEAMGGTIWLKSRVGEGSTFGFNLPVLEGKS